MKARHEIANGKTQTNGIKAWIACMMVFALEQIAFYEDGLYQSVEHDGIFWVIIAIATCTTGFATAIYLKKNSAQA
jgi:hypothetical protein